jgi:hypothetical protein
MSVDDRGSYYTDGTRTDVTPGSEHRHGRLGKLAAGAGAAGLLAAFLKRRRSRSQSRTRTDGASSRHDSESFVDEKYSDHGRKQHTWRDRLLIAGAAGGAIAAARKIFGGRRHEDEGSSISEYPHRPLGGAHSITETDVSRIEEGRVPTTPTRTGVGMAALPAAAAIAAGSPSRHSRHSRHSRTDSRPAGGSIDSYDSWEESNLDSPGKAKRKTHTLRDGIAALGVAGFLRHKWNERKDTRDEVRVAAMKRRDREDEKLARRNSSRRRYTGDGIPRPPHRRHGSVTDSEMSPLGGSNPELSLHSIPRPSGVPTTPDVTAANTAANAGGSYLPPPPPMPATIIRHDSSGSEALTSSGGGRNNRHRVGEAAAAGLAGAAAGAALAGHERNSSRRRDSSATSSVHSPRASVQVKMHNDGRHVTLRRLNPNEKAAEKARRQRRPGRSGSISSAGGAGASGDEHWRRVQRMEAQQAAQLRADTIAAGEQQHNIPPPPALVPGPPSAPPSLRPSITQVPPPPAHGTFSPTPSDLLPPPPIPALGSNMGGSPGSVYGSGPSNVDSSRAESNRRRRRAERARLEAAERERTGNRVDFT